MNEWLFLGLCVSAVGIASQACSSDDTSPGTSPSTTAAAVAGAADTHCGGKEVVTVDPAVCKAVAQGGDAGTDGAAAGGDYGDTLFNAEGDDDDCKYHVKWTSTAVAEDANVTFTVVLTNKKDGTALASAPVSAEIFLDSSHPAPNSGQVTKETSPGTYAVGPIRFDAPGRWTVRFHVHEDCNDSESSPHGHAAFFVQVP